MIPEPVTIGGRKGTAVYLNDEWAVVSKEIASLARVLFDDGGTAFYHVSQERSAEFDPDQPRDKTGRWTDGGGTPAVDIDVRMAGGRYSDKEAHDLVKESISEESLTSIKDIAQAMTDEGDKAAILLAGEEGDHLSIGVASANGERRMSISVDFSGKETVAEWDIVQFNDTVSPRQARQTLAATLDTMDRLDVDRIELDASLSDGGYLWARMGFEAQHPKNFQAMANVRVDERSLKLSDEQRKVLRSLIQAEGSKTNSKLPSILADAPGGKVLLRGSSWAGTLNLRKAGALDRMNHFLGRRRKK